jgi:hypothetical protein
MCCLLWPLLSSSSGLWKFCELLACCVTVLMVRCCHGLGRSTTRMHVCSVRVLRKNALPNSATRHVHEILDGLRTATTQKDLPFHQHLTNLVVALNKSNAHKRSASHACQPHHRAKLRGATLHNSLINTQVPEGAVVMYGGPKLALSLTFVMDTGEEKDFCTLFKSDVRDVRYKATGNSDAALVRSLHAPCILSCYVRVCSGLRATGGFQVTFGLHEVRSAIGTNLCLQQAAQSLTSGAAGLIMELELSTQDAKLLAAELKGPSQEPQKDVHDENASQRARKPHVCEKPHPQKPPPASAKVQRTQVHASCGCTIT